jgi:hypothetical protein
MTFVVFLFSAVLFAIGAISIYSGYPMIQIERGWAEVIAGAVAISGAVVAFALAAVLMRLRAIHGALTAATLRNAPLEVPQIPAVQATDDVGLRPTLSESPSSEQTDTRGPEPVPMLEPEPVETPSDVRHGLWKRIRMGEETTPDSLPETGSNRRVGLAELTPVIPVEEPAAAPAQAETGAPDVLPPMTSDRDGFRRLRPTLADASSFRTMAPDTDHSIDWLDQGLRSRSGSRIEVAPGGDPGSPKPEEDGHELSQHAIPAATFVEAESVAHEAEAEAIENASEVTIIGRYQAGVASYIMYSDGTIEVETEGEMVRRFGSMDELKAFINRQETSVS